MKKLIKNILLFISPSLKKAVFYEKTKLEKWQEYAEKLLIESGIDLENVLVHNYGKFGLEGKRMWSNYTTQNHNGMDFRFDIPKPELPYIIVPEITGWWEFHAWIHEIGHYKFNHHSELIKPTYIQEYEAEKFSLDTAKESGLVDDFDFIDMKFSAVSYLDSHIDKAIDKGEINYIEDIPEEVIKFLYQIDCMKDIVKEKFVEKEKKEIVKQKKFDRYYR